MPKDKVVVLRWAGSGELSVNPLASSDEELLERLKFHLNARPMRRVATSGAKGDPEPAADAIVDYLRRLQPTHWQWLRLAEPSGIVVTCPGAGVAVFYVGPWPAVDLWPGDAVQVDSLRTFQAQARRMLLIDSLGLARHPNYEIEGAGAAYSRALAWRTGRGRRR